MGNKASRYFAWTFRTFGRFEWQRLYTYAIFPLLSFCHICGSVEGVAFSLGISADCSVGRILQLTFAAGYVIPQFLLN